jgi:hypothetical protein
MFGSSPAAFLAAPAAPASLQVAQGSDGSLYIVRGSGVWALVPAPISDADLAGLTQVGEVDGVILAENLLLVAPSPSPTAVPTLPAASPPAAASGS